MTRDQRIFSARRLNLAGIKVVRSNARPELEIQEQIPLADFETLHEALLKNISDALAIPRELLDPDLVNRPYIELDAALFQPSPDSPACPDVEIRLNEPLGYEPITGALKPGFIEVEEPEDPDGEEWKL